MWCRVHHDTADVNRTVTAHSWVLAPLLTIMMLCTTGWAHVCRDKETWSISASPATLIPGAAVPGFAASEATYQGTSGAQAFIRA